MAELQGKIAREYKPVFYRSREELDLSGLPGKSQEIIRIALEKEVLIASLGAKLKIAKLKLIRDWFYNVDFVNFGNPIENAFLSTLIPDGFADSKEVQQKVVDCFAAFDPSIIGFAVEDLPEEKDSVPRVRIGAVHQIIGSEKPLRYLSRTNQTAL